MFYLAVLFSAFLIDSIPISLTVYKMAEDAEVRLERAIQIIEDITETGGYMKNEIKKAMQQAVRDIKMCVTEIKTNRGKYTEGKVNQCIEAKEPQTEATQGDENNTAGLVATSINEPATQSSGNRHSLTPGGGTIEAVQTDYECSVDTGKTVQVQNTLSETELERKITDNVNQKLKYMMEAITNDIRKMIKEEIKNTKQETREPHKYAERRNQPTYRDRESNMLSDNDAKHEEIRRNRTTTETETQPRDIISTNAEEPLTENEEVDSGEETNGFVLVNKRRNRTVRRPKITIGTDESTHPTLQAGERTAWLYVGRLSQQTTGSNIKEHFQKKGIDPQDITCEELRTLGTNKAFKVGIPYQCLEQVVDAAYWPKGILVRPFRSPRQRYYGGADRE